MPSCDWSYSFDAWNFWSLVFAALEDWMVFKNKHAKIMGVFCNDIPEHHRPKQMVSGMCIYAIIDIFAL